LFSLCILVSQRCFFSSHCLIVCDVNFPGIVCITDTPAVCSIGCCTQDGCVAPCPPPCNYIPGFDCSSKAGASDCVEFHDCRLPICNGNFECVQQAKYKEHGEECDPDGGGPLDVDSGCCDFEGGCVLDLNLDDTCKYVSIKKVACLVGVE